MEETLAKVGLSDESFNDFSTVNRLHNAALITNEIILLFLERLLVKDCYDFVKLLAPECILPLVEYNPFHKRARNLQSKVSHLQKRKEKNQGEIADLLSEKFNLEIITPQQADTPRKKLLREKNKRLKVEVKNSASVVKKLKINIDEVEVEKSRVEEEGKMQVDELEGQLSLAQEEVEKTVSTVNEIGKELTTYKKK